MRPGHGPPCLFLWRLSVASQVPRLKVLPQTVQVKV